MSRPGHRKKTVCKQQGRKKTTKVSLENAATPEAEHYRNDNLNQTVITHMLPFSKMHGLGNDFMVIDALTANRHINSAQVKKWGDRHTGVGFDQLLLVEAPYDPRVDFHYRIFNADGQEVNQCGNGVRCLADFIHRKGLTNKNILRISTRKSIMTVYYQDSKHIRVDMGTPIFTPDLVPFKAQKAEHLYLFRLNQETIMGSVVSMGNPHLVIEVEDVETVEVERLGALLTQHERFPEGVNVGFMQVVSRQSIRLRVYERGTGETRSCGSGACAAVAVGIQRGILENLVKVDLTGGQLSIDWQPDKNEGHLFMTGPSELTFEGQIAL